MRKGFDVAEACDLLCLCVCVCVCARARARARVRACLCMMLEARLKVTLFKQEKRVALQDERGSGRERLWKATLFKREKARSNTAACVRVRALVTVWLHCGERGRA